MKSHQVVLLLGSNICAKKNIKLALSLLEKEVTIVTKSQVWETEAVGSDGPNFLNMALLIETQFDSDTLKQRVITPIETQLKRVRTKDKNSPRTIDIDPIIFDNTLLDSTITLYAHIAVPVAQVLPLFIVEGETIDVVANSLRKKTTIERREI